MSSGWTSGRSIPDRTYLLKHGTRTVSAEVDRELSLNQIGKIVDHDVAAADLRPVFGESRQRRASS